MSTIRGGRGIELERSAQSTLATTPGGCSNLWPLLRRRHNMGCYGLAEKLKEMMYEVVVRTSRLWCLRDYMFYLHAEKK